MNVFKVKWHFDPFACIKVVIYLKFRRPTIPPTMWSKLSLKCCCYNQADMQYLIVSFFCRILCIVSYQEFTELIHALLGNKRMPLPAHVYHAVRKTFDLNEEELKGYTFERCRQCLKTLLYFSFNFITNIDTKYNVYMYIQVNIELIYVTLTKNVSTENFWSGVVCHTFWTCKLT